VRPLEAVVEASASLDIFFHPYVLFTTIIYKKSHVVSADISDVEFLEYSVTLQLIETVPHRIAQTIAGLVENGNRVVESFQLGSFSVLID